MGNVIDLLTDRGFVEQTTADNLNEILAKPATFYLGIDPTANSMHLGHLAGVMMSRFLQLAGHKPVFLVGGATGLIGDPSFKDKERPLLTSEQVQENVRGLQKNLRTFFADAESSGDVTLLNNYDWFSKMSMVEFLRDVGKRFRVGPMMGKDSVRTRLASEEGMSFTEFSYQLLQGYDFYYLSEHHGVSLQIGGSDQFGNITAGIEYTRKVSGKAVHGMTFPLLTRSDGKKFGKTESGAIWLSSELCSPYELYQYLYRVSDQDVIKMLKLLTTVDIEEIRRFESAMGSDAYEVNSAQKRLAEEVVRFVHKEEGLQQALQGTKALNPGKMEFDEAGLGEISKNVPSIELTREDVLGSSYIDLVVKASLVPSKGAARRLIQNNGAYLNGEKVSDVAQQIDSDHLLKGDLVVVSSGKKTSFSSK